MKPNLSSVTLDRLVDPLSDCLTLESAKRLVKLRADSQLQARVNKLAEKCSDGTLTPDERAEYGNYVAFGTFVALLKSKARKRLAASSSVA